MAAPNPIPALKGKITIDSTLTVRTGMHIGAAKDFAPIGAVDSVVVRDPLTKIPVIPGSSLKGKLRTLLARADSAGPALQPPQDDPPVVLRLFGSSHPVMFSRLQFADAFMSQDSVKQIQRQNTDLYLTEVKFENAIDRLTSVANPRQIERVPAGAQFAVQITYNIENDAEIAEDMQSLARAIALLHLDYLGGHGSRGYGRVFCDGFQIRAHFMTDAAAATVQQQVASIFKGAGLDVLAAV